MPFGRLLKHLRVEIRKLLTNEANVLDALGTIELLIALHPSLNDGPARAQHGTSAGTNGHAFRKGLHGDDVRVHVFLSGLPLNDRLAAALDRLLP